MKKKLGGEKQETRKRYMDLGKHAITVGELGILQGNVRQKGKAKEKLEVKGKEPMEKVGRKEKAKGKRRAAKGKEKERVSKIRDKEKAKGHSRGVAIRVGDHTSAETVQREQQATVRSNVYQASER